VALKEDAPAIAGDRRRSYFGRAETPESDGVGGGVAGFVGAPWFLGVSPRVPSGCMPP